MSSEPADLWKQKYLSNLDRLERRERQLEEIEMLMRDGIARLSVVAEGHDGLLDEQLQKLRKAVRGQQDVTAIRRQIDAVTELARTLDDQTQKHREPESERKTALKSGKETGPHSGTESVPVKDATHRLGLHEPDARRLLAALLSQVRLPSADASLASALADELANARLEDELGALVGRLAGLINRGLAPATAGPTPPMVAEPATNEVLIQLLNCIPVPLELGARMEAIKVRLMTGVEGQAWREVLHGIAELIAEMRARIEAEKSELENFLVQLTDRLRDLEDHMQSAETARQASYEGGQRLEQRMQAEVGQIESSVRQAANLEQLKSDVRTRIDLIRQHLDEHRLAESQRQAQLEERLEHMTTRLHAVEQETTHLRAHLRKRKIQAMSDPLTGIANRTAFEDRLARECGRWKRYRHALGFMIMDVDHFKQINDNFGHKAGDRALKLIAQVLQQNLRETDFIARYGGEEFVALLPETPSARMTEVAEKLRKAIETCSFHHRGVRVPITLSIGYAEFQGEDTADTAFQRADSALYLAKAEGRNRCRNGDLAESRAARPADRR